MFIFNLHRFPSSVKITSASFSHSLLLRLRESISKLHHQHFLLFLFLLLFLTSLPSSSSAPSLLPGREREPSPSISSHFFSWGSSSALFLLTLAATVSAFILAWGSANQVTVWSLLPLFSPWAISSIDSSSSALFYWPTPRHHHRFVVAVGLVVLVTAVGHCCHSSFLFLFGSLLLGVLPVGVQLSCWFLFIQQHRAPPALHQQHREAAASQKSSFFFS